MLREWKIMGTWFDSMVLFESFMPMKVFEIHSRDLNYFLSLFKKKRNFRLPIIPACISDSLLSFSFA